MNLNHYRAIVRKEFYQILRDPGTLLLLTLGPVFLLLVFVFMLTSDVRDVPTAVVDLANNDASTHLIESLDSAKEIRIAQHLQTADDANPLFDQGKIRILVVIPAGYGNTLAMVTGGFPQFQVVVDGTEPVSAERALNRIYTLVEQDMRQIVTSSPVGGLLASLLDTPVQIDITRLYNPDLRDIVGYFPGIAAMVLSLPGIALTLAIVRERELGTLENLVATPISKLGLLLPGKITPYLIFGTLDALLIVAIGRAMFDIPFRGNLLAYVLASFLFMLSNMGLGLLLSVILRSQQVAMIVSILVFLIPGFFLSGVFFPAWAMPTILRLDLLALPVTHYVAISQGMYLQGSTLADLWLNGIALAVLSIAMVALSMMVFRKKVA
ncbi:MAG: ABC transporter permease [Anaerolineae bacterium]|nr:ABC transporter permease [Anaerolineae bacterium]